jgi:hypothetical protein
VGDVIPQCSLQRVIVVPRNGYANRLQAWASSAILAAELDASLNVCWVPEPAAAASANSLFATELMHQQFISENTLLAQMGQPMSTLPKYLTLNSETGLIVLAGHDVGEQPFMTELTRLLADDSRPQTLVIVAGGKFHLPSGADFVRQRSIFYQRLSWSTELDTLVSTALRDQSPFSALHVRQTDRSQQAPPKHAIRRGLKALSASGAPRPLFISADTPEGRETWMQESATLGFRPWTRTGADLDRADPRAGIDALVDWRLMASSVAIAYSRASTFSEEAAVASGRFAQAIPLGASVHRQRVRGLTRLARSAVTYPQRLWGH